MQNEHTYLKYKMKGLDLILRYKADESGATGIEYGLIASLIGILGVSSAGFVGDSISGTFDKIGDALEPPVSVPTSNGTSGPLAASS